MSVKHLALAADIQGIPSTCKLVLYGLAMTSDSLLGETRATNAKLQDLTCLSERSIRTALRQLEKGNLIGRSPLGYYLTLPAVRS